jgi:excisionase family DNA binding protein
MHDDHRATDAGQQPTPSAPPPSDQRSSPRRRLVSLPDAAAVLGLSVPSLRRLTGSGRLHSVKLTRRVLVDLRDVDRLIEESKDRRGW